jgi:hypothetical protein
VQDDRCQSFRVNRIRNKSGKKPQIMTEMRVFDIVARKINVKKSKRKGSS